MSQALGQPTFWLALSQTFQKGKTSYYEALHRASTDVDGFHGGLSAENYISITGAARATATRDLQDLVAKGTLISTGVLKSTRYRLNVEK